MGTIGGDYGFVSLCLPICIDLVSPLYVSTLMSPLYVLSTRQHPTLC
ncbi:Hypothetical protein BAMTRB_051 [Escherichia phage vB_Eco_Bam]|uniref:Uncharacterized protein n=1 Tax=Escherichia phage vB_Eco_Bam TaxID=2898833 RepID=A0A9P0Y768_9CAUD|nr:hypothetical protein TITUS_048 [Escherichia phage vB_Eco_Titus]CAI9888974.1 Hypothetical protein BAMTRB_051 [Escherichia phage vB_Eco_Bam]